MRKLLSNFILFCSGVNTSFLKNNCPDERHKYFPIGLGVIVTSSLAFIAMLFATHSIFKLDSFTNEIILILFSLFWGFAIFMIDWGLIKTMTKPIFSQLSGWDKFKYSIPVVFRLFVAIIISYSISRPLEVKIYEKRLKAQIEKDRQDFVKREFDARNIKILQMDSLINTTIATETTLIEQRNAGPKTVTFNSLIESQKQSESELSNLTALNNRKITDKEIERRGIYNSDNSYFYDTLNVRQMHKWASSRINTINTEIKNLKSQISTKSQECENIRKEIVSQESSFQQSYDGVIASTQKGRENKVSEKELRQKEDSDALAEITKASYVSFDPEHPGLITQLESMSNFEETPEGKSAKAVRIILLLVIICIDTAPIVIKLLTKRGVYDEMMENEADRLTFLSKQENLANKFLIKELSIAQREVLIEAINNWKEREKQDSGLADNYINRSIN